MRAILYLILISFLAGGAVSAQSKYTFTIKKAKFNDLDTIIPCHDKLFHNGSLGETKPNLKGFGFHYHNINYAWIDFKNSKFYYVKDSGSVITKNHSNGVLHWLETDKDLYEKEFELHSFNTDSANGLWKGRREDTISRKEVIKTVIILKNCEIYIKKTTGYYKKEYLYSYKITNPTTNLEEKKWRLTFKSPLITWIPIGKPEEEFLKDKIPNKVLKPYVF